MSYEKVNPSHPDKLADRIGGAIVDLAYKKQDNPKIACEVLLGHGKCFIILETSVKEFQNENPTEIFDVVKRIVGDVETEIIVSPQDVHLAQNQENEIKCGDNGIFKGTPISEEITILSKVARNIYSKYPFDGKYIYNKEFEKLIICQSHANEEDLRKMIRGSFPFIRELIVNPLGEWEGGPDVDTGVTGRKLGSDMGEAVTGGSIIGKDLSKADVSVNIVCHILAQKRKCNVYAHCAIGDTQVLFDDDKGNHWSTSYKEIVEEARTYINKLGGFEKLAEWGLV